LQVESGAFRATIVESGEADMRFLYCACAISAILEDFSAIDCDRAEQYVLDCITYEGGIAVVPDGEAQGGACYCAIASLALMGRLPSSSSSSSSASTQEKGATMSSTTRTAEGERSGRFTDDHKYALAQWCLGRQVGGYQGRTNKDPDSCYSFWVGATLSLLGVFEDTDCPSTQSFLLEECQLPSHSGGFSKYPGAYPDMLHSFYSICWLTMMASSASSSGCPVSVGGDDSWDSTLSTTGSSAAAGIELGEAPVVSDGNNSTIAVEDKTENSVNMPARRPSIVVGLRDIDPRLGICKYKSPLA